MESDHERVLTSLDHVLGFSPHNLNYIAQYLLKNSSNNIISLLSVEKNFFLDIITHIQRNLF